MASDREVLPSTVRASNYNLSLYDIDTAAPWSFQGTVKVEVEVKAETKEITLNAVQLKIHSAEVQTEQGKTEGSIKTSNVSYDEKNQRATLHFDQPIPQSHKALVTITFQGTVNNEMAGFYRSKYKPVVEAAASVPRDEEYHYMFSTQFESSDARRAFPCFDEPNLKASFEFAIEIPEDQTALSNMPESGTQKSKRSGYKVVSFEKSPIMSTYLYAWAFGDFEYVEDFTRRKYNGKNLPVRVYSTRGLIDQGKLALDSAHKIVDFYSEVFQIDYPLPKVDMLAVHEFSHGAMENWGLITYRTTAVLFSEEHSDQANKNRVVYVVAHELAHQWFGNLVTMDWWNELWLNEGFATWVGWFALDHLHPDWNVWGQFVGESMQMAFTLDGLKSSHPIEVPVRNALEVDQIFDAISYRKGSSVIRMLAAHLTPKVFLQGVANYLKNHTYGNATTTDLWNAISKESGQDVNALMDAWIRKIGFPVVTVAEEPGQISIRQSRFLTAGDVKAEDDSTTWWVPLALKTGGANAQVHNTALSAKEDTIRDIDDDFYKLNTDQCAFYRTNLPPKRLAKLGTQLDRLSVEDRIGLISDATALAKSGDATTAAALSFLEGFSNEDNYLVWSEVLGSLGGIRSNFADDAEIAEGLRKFTLKLTTSAAEKMGWETVSSKDYLTGRKQALLLQSAALAGHEPIIAEAQKRFKAYIDGDKNAIPPSLRRGVYKIAIKNGGRAEYDAVIKEHNTTTSVDGKEIALQSLGLVQSKEMALEYLEWSFSGKVGMQDVHSPAIAVANNSKVRDAIWEHFQKNWKMIADRLGGNKVLIHRYVGVSLKQFASTEKEQEISAFFKDKDLSGFDQALAQALDSVNGRAKYFARDREVIKEWLSAHGYIA